MIRKASVLKWTFRLIMLQTSSAVLLKTVSPKFFLGDFLQFSVATGKHQCKTLFFNKVADCSHVGLQLYKKEPLTQVINSEFGKSSNFVNPNFANCCFCKNSTEQLSLTMLFFQTQSNFPQFHVKIFSHNNIFLFYTILSFSN